MSTWWIHEPFLLGSSNPSDSEIHTRYADGFRIIISLLLEPPEAPNYDVRQALKLGYKRHSIAIRDFRPPSLEQLYMFIALLSVVPRNSRVLVHCQGGAGRTGTMAAGYWIANGMPAADAIRRTCDANPDAENEVQKAVLIEFERHIHDARRVAVETFRKLVALLYREIGVLQSRNHKQLARKRNLSSGFFTNARKQMARDLYSKSLGILDPPSILDLFESNTGLSLHDVERAFREGDWKNSAGGYSFGGPNWAIIASATLCLGGAIANHDVAHLKRLLDLIPILRHNNGRIIEKFSQLE